MMGTGGIYSAAGYFQHIQLSAAFKGHKDNFKRFKINLLFVNLCKRCEGLYLFDWDMLFSTYIFHLHRFL